MEEKPVDETVWLTVAEAARRLGVTTTAVRRRIKRRTLEVKQGNRGILVRLPLTGQLAEREAEPVREPSSVPFSERFQTSALRADLETAREQLTHRDRQIATQAAEIAGLKAERDGLQTRLADKDGELRERLADKDEQISDLRSERDRLLGVIEAQTEQVKLLTDQRHHRPHPPKPRWRRWFSR